MTPHTKAPALFAVALLSLCFTPRAPAQQPKPGKELTWKDRDGNIHSIPGTWKDGEGNIRSRADLDKILAQHKLWVVSGRQSGTRADLSYAFLTGADLSYADLRDASLSGADLGGANLTHADLWGANLTHALFLGGANLTYASLRDAVLNEASLDDAWLGDADLGGAHLTHAHLWGADLSYAHLIGADLTGAELNTTALRGVVFEPKNLPPIESIALARGLELMSYEQNPGPLTQLRKQFQDAGYREQERAITCALNRRQAELGSPIERWFKRIAFDYTCQYGFTPGRPLRIVLWLWLFFALVYAVFMHRPGASGIYFIGSRVWRGRSNSQGLQIRPRPVRASKRWKLPFLWLRREWRMLRAALFFSLMSAFNIGFRDINFGRWVRMLTKREYDLKAVGWARTVSGFQSLLSVYLIALWVLTYFGRPFG